MECKICKKDLPKEQFSFKDKSKGRLQNKCKSCFKDYRKKYYQKNKIKAIEKSAETSKNIRIRNQQFVWDYLKKNPCIDCFEKDPVVLEFDHREGVEKIKDVSLMILHGHSIENIKKEIEKCDVRCANCHRKETARRSGWYSNIIM